MRQAASVLRGVAQGEEESNLKKVKQKPFPEKVAPETKALERPDFHYG